MTHTTRPLGVPAPEGGSRVSGYNSTGEREGVGAPHVRFARRILSWWRAFRSRRAAERARKRLALYAEEHGAARAVRPLPLTHPQRRRAHKQAAMVLQHKRGGGDAA